MGIGFQVIELCGGTVMDFHKKLKALREHRGMTQAQVAEAMGSAKNTYIGYEKGSREPRLSELLKLSEVLDAELSDLCLERQNTDLSGVLKHTLKRAQSLSAKEKYCLYKVMEGYILSCEIEQSRNRHDYDELMEEIWTDSAVRDMEEAQILEMVKGESREEQSSPARA